MLGSSTPFLPGGGFGSPLGNAADRAGAGAAATTVVAPAYVPGPGVTSLGELSAATPLTVLVGLLPPSPGSLEAAAQEVSVPGSPTYHHFLTPAQVADRFGPSPDTTARAVRYFQAEGLIARASPDGWTLTLTGTAAEMGRAFGTNFRSYDGGGRTFFAHATPAVLPSDLGAASAYGLGNVSLVRPSVVRLMGGPPLSAPAPAACSSSPPYEPCSIYGAYNVSGLLTAGTNGTGFRLAVVDVYDAAETQSNLVSDLGMFDSQFGISGGSVQYLYPVPTSRHLNSTYTGWGLEESLDLEWARAMAPGAALKMTFAPDPTTGLYASVDWLIAHDAADVISLSWGEPDVGIFNAYNGACPGGCNATADGSYTILHPVLAAAALEGITVLAASGDCGAAMGTSGVATSYPASDSYVVGVGATDLTVTTGLAYSSERAWSGNSSGATSPGCQNQGGSGGGWSPFPRPAWQAAAGLPASNARRGVPDVAIDGGTAVAIYSGGTLTGVGGTSVSSPIWAGLVTLADQSAGAPLGLVTPSLYAVDRSPLASKSFHDVKSGTNGYSAGTGWDPVTGIGSPNAGFLLPRLSRPGWSPSAFSVNLTVTPRSGAAPLAVTFHATAVGASAAVYGYDVDFGDYNATWSPNGWGNWTYRIDGVFLARATGFLIDGNSSVSLPTAVQVGGTGSLNVTLAASVATVAVGVPVTFNATTTGGAPPYRYTFSYGDGSYWPNTTSASAVHAFPAAGAYCANVIAWDSATPPASGASLRVGVGVGGTPAPACGNPPSLHATFTLPGSVPLPGDLSMPVNASGGTPPYSVRYVSDDPYVTACQCGIFKVAGPHHVWAFVNDSLLGSTVVETNLTLTPALVGWFNASSLTGPAPLAVSFTGRAVGGANGSSSLVTWSFGDGASATGASVGHTYPVPGFYVASGTVTDSLGVEVGRTFLVDAQAPGAGGSLAVNASLAPAPGNLGGALLSFQASASGGTMPYTYRWDFGSQGSAFGARGVESFGAPQCAPGYCPTNLSLTVTDANGTPLTVPIVLAQPPGVAIRSSALGLTESFSPSSGTTPLGLSGTATTRGMPSTAITWTYAPGASTNGPSGSYTYLAPGNYTLNVSATDPWGDLTVHDHAITVTGLARVAPRVSGGPNLTQGILPLPVSFAAAAVGGGGGPYAYDWQFGDGAGAVGSAASHTYAASGAFDANLTVTDALGTPTRLNWTIHVYRMTSVAWTIDVVPTHLVAFENFSVNVSARPSCASDSVPLCGAGAVGASVRIQNGSATGPGIGAIDLAPNGVGTWTISLVAPSGPLPPAAACGGGSGGAPSSVLLSVAATGFGFSGNTSALLPVAAPTSPGPPCATSPYGLLLVVGVSAAAVVAAVTILVRLRRRRRRGGVSP